MRPLSCDDWRQAARARLPRFVFDYLDGGAGDETALRHNRTAWETLRLAPRVLRNTTQVSCATQVMGQWWARPYGIAPTGLNGLIRPGGDLALARAAARHGVPFIQSTASNERLEAVRAAIPEGMLWLQLYVMQDPGITDQLLRRAQALGVDTLVLTVDVPVSGLRLRDQRNGFKLPFRLTPRLAWDLLTHPRWSLQQAWAGQPSFANLIEDPAAALSPQAQAALLARAMDRSLDWAALGRLRDRWPGKLVIKGLLHEEDAGLALQAGVDGLILSNHGGRQFDGAVSPLEALPRVLARTAGRLPVMLDSGIRSGTEVAKALSQGAAAVFVGRATLYGLAAQGEAGVSSVLDLLAEDLERGLALLGAEAVSRLGALGAGHWRSPSLQRPGDGSPSAPPAEWKGAGPHHQGDG
ncbi:alpha-hydroxy acid oxidase [Ideonella livida]|uniref:Alpha-hydroxy-acid oxidizing protein n=1 Tax=Ideonella livida TaxID=2707176 RepID=A0A7C9PKL3_9BURK|nr:alpha-hydroxy acid oxidase [Ideonella livida]NDY93470.1 alpha-hydroxy-acid oxidizing protein [Ideonella livida]